MIVSSMTKTRRFLAIAFPHLSTDRLRRTTAGAFYALPDEQPLVVIDKVQNTLALFAIDRAAQALGLCPGLALADARARAPALAVAEADPKADSALLEKIADWCDRYTPYVSRPSRSGLVLDITGCSHLFGGEREMLTDVLRRLCRFGLQATAAIAGNPDAARAMSVFGQPGIVPAGADAAAVRCLPIAALGAEAATITALHRAGLKIVGDLADRPRAPLAARFGSGLLYQLDQMRGVVDVPFSPRRIIPVCRAERSFVDPITRTEDVFAALCWLTAEVAQKLEDRGEGGRHFEASVFRVDGAVRRLAITTARPSRDPAAVTRLLSERLETLADPLDAGFGFERIQLAAILTEPLAPAQRPLDPGESDRQASEAIAGLVERLSIRLGGERVVRFEAVDTHIPERATRCVPALTGASHASWPRARETGEPPSRPLSLFDPPQPIEALAEVPDGPPLRFRWRRVLHQVVRAEGPERIAPEWWRKDKGTPTRDYYRVEDRDGRRFWLFREGLYGREMATPRWFVHGLFA